MIKHLFIWSLTCLLLIKSVLPLSCGVRKVRSTELIVHGYDTRAGEWPWHVAIYHRDRRTTSYACGGTLISETFVVTAAHCVLNQANRHQLSNKRIFVRLGVHNLDALNGETLQEHAVERIHQPGEFSASQSLKNDIALLELATVARFNDYVQPACVSLTKDLTGQLGTVVGWGVTEDDEVSSTLKSAQMPVIDSVKCLASNRDVFGVTLDEGLFCAGYTNGTSVCNGDSGGGLFFSKDNRWYLGGIVSFSEARSLGDSLCQTRGYAAFTKVLTYLPWIASITKQQLLSDRCEPRYPESNVNYPNLLPRNCGVYNSNRLYQGQKAKVFEFPWMALLRYKKQYDPANWTDICTGSLINRRYVLTTGICISDHKSPSTVILGEHTIGQDIDCNVFNGERECAPPVQEFGVECITRHQKYNFQIHSIALIRLDKDVIFEDHIQPVCLPVTASLKKLDLPQYIITGWGAINNIGKVSPILLKAVSTVLPYKLDFGGTPVHLIGELNGPHVCLGDHGAPMGYVVNSNGLRFVQFGIISFTFSCEYRSPFYTRVADYMDWIVANMRP